MKLSNPLDDHDELLPLERARAEALLQVLLPVRLNRTAMKELKELTGLTGSQFDKSLNLLVKTGLATIGPRHGCVHVEPSDAGRELREIL
jgi:hypothetical protein